jgi:hypothetical protein
VAGHFFAGFRLLPRCPPRCSSVGALTGVGPKRALLLAPRNGSKPGVYDNLQTIGTKGSLGARASPPTRRRRPRRQRPGRGRRHGRGPPHDCAARSASDHNSQLPVPRLPRAGSTVHTHARALKRPQCCTAAWPHGRAIDAWSGQSALSALLGTGGQTSNYAAPNRGNALPVLKRAQYSVHGPHGAPRPGSSHQ